MVKAISTQSETRPFRSPSAAKPSGVKLLVTRLSGVLVAGVFYAAVVLIPFAPAQRYFLGHPVAIAATVLFWIAAAALLGQWLEIRRQRRWFAQIQDDLLAPPEDEEAGGASANVRGLCERWLERLDELPEAAHASRLVGRLSELLERQIRRGNARHLADDLREVATREADDAHDSLQLVRIIVWAIPMLGFLGTVIGITQTLGGLDFSDGSAAVERLKSGLYVAFDTTALGLVLSVVAIFLQFPVERAEQQLLGQIDRRAGELLAAHLPDPAVDGTTAQMTALCDGVLAAVQQSLGKQAELWRATIDGAHEHWQNVVSITNDELGRSIGDAVGQAIGPALQDHSRSMQETQQEGVEAIDQRWQQWQLALSDNARILLAHQKTLVRQAELLADGQARATELVALQETLHQNLQVLDSAQQQVDRSLESAAGAEQLTGAIRTLARAMEVLTEQLPPAGPMASTRQAA